MKTATRINSNPYYSVIYDIRRRWNSKIPVITPVEREIIRGQLEAIEPMDRILLRSIALAYLPMKPRQAETFLQFLFKAKLFPVPLTYSQVPPTLKRLISRGFLEDRWDKTIACNPRYLEAAARLADGGAAIPTGVMAALSSQGSSDTKFVEPGVMLQQARLCIYTNRWELFQHYFLIIMGSDSPFEAILLLLDVFANPFQKDQLEAVPLSTRGFIGFYMAIFEEAELVRFPGLRECIYTNFQPSTKIEETLNDKYQHAQICMFEGRWSELAKIAESSPELVQFIFKGVFALANGASQDSVKHFKHALTLYRKNNTRNLMFQGIPALLLLISFVRDQSPEQLEEVERFLESTEIGRDPFNCSSLYLFQNFYNSRIKRQKLPWDLSMLKASEDLPMPRAATFLRYLIQQWVRGVPPADMQAFQEFRASLEDPAFAWFAHELATLDAVWKGKTVDSSSTGHGFLATLFGQGDVWNSILERMEKCVSDDSSTENSREQKERIVWEIEIGEGRDAYGRLSEAIYFNPKLQKKRLKGGWTAGRKLIMQYGVIPPLPGWAEERDKKAWEKVKEGVRRGNYLKSQLPLALALVGHPRVFDAGGNSIKVIEQPPCLNVTKEFGGIVLQATPHLEIGSTIGYDLDIEKLVLSQFSPPQIKLLQVLPQDTVFPEASASRLQETLSRISGTIDVHIEGDVFSLSFLPALEPDQTIVLRITPLGEGIRIEAGFRPLGPDGTFFRPGAGVLRIVGKSNTEKGSAGQSTDDQQILPISPIKSISRTPKVSSIATVDVDSTTGESVIPTMVGMPANAPGCGGKLREGNTISGCDRGQHPEKYVVNRSFETELSLIDQLRENCPSLQTMGNGDFAVDLLSLKEALAFFLEMGADREGIRFECHKDYQKPVVRRVDGNNMKIRAHSVEEWLEIDGSIELDGTAVMNMRELLESIDGGDQYIPLTKGRFIHLTDQFRARLLDLQEMSDPTRDARRFPKILLPLVDTALGDFQHVEIDSAWKERLELLKDIDTRTHIVPATLQAELRDYQKEAFVWLSRIADWGAGACLADDMGLGKTLEALSVVLDMAAQNPTLVVAPTSVCGNWEREIKRFAPTLCPRMFREGDREKLVSDARPYDVIIASYSLMQIEIDLFTSREWAVIVLDEAQAIKNYASMRAKAAFRLRGKFRIALSGTPIENHLGELWSLFRFLNPGLLGSAEKFQTRFFFPISKREDQNAKQRLKRIIHPFILRRTKSQVLPELPAKTEIQLQAELDVKTMAMYDALRQKALENISGLEGPSGTKHIQILAEIMKLRRFCCHPDLVVPEAGLEAAKLALLDELVRELRENRHRALIFSQFTGFLAIVRKRFDGNGVKYQYLDGTTLQKQRELSVEAFQKGEGDVFLLSLKAGGLGLNLTAADYVIILDPWWNPAVETQAADRAHRIGQERPVTVYRLITRGTIEEKIVELHARKKDLAESLLEGTDAVKSLSAEELMKLITDI
ncbi:MAG: DEAD/DEAH box helicase [Candidatus Ozemobacteraceae bacterium]